MVDLDKLEQLALRATPGPWCDRGFGSIHPESGGSLVAVTVTKGGCLPGYVENSAFIAAANPANILALTAELRRLRADLDGAIEMANKNALDASRWQHIYHGPYVVCRVYADGRLENLGGSYVGKYAVDDGMAAFCAAHPKEGV